MVGEICEIYMSRILKLVLNAPPWLEKILNITSLKLLKSPLNYPEGAYLVHSCRTLEISDHSCTQNTGKISARSAPGIGNSTSAPVNLSFHFQDLVEKGHTLKTGFYDILRY